MSDTSEVDKPKEEVMSEEIFQDNNNKLRKL